MSTVSVIIPCYNYGRFLDQCVQSVLTQDGVDVHVLVIDDASTDGSKHDAAGLRKRDQRVDVVFHERNMGHIATYNEGLEWAHGEYLLLLSADDYLTPGALTRAVAVMDAYPNVGLVYGRAASDGDESSKASKPHGRVVHGHDWIAERCRQMNNVVPTPTAVVRTSLQHRVGGYRADSPYAGDLEMWLRLAAYADVAELQTNQAIYRQHGNNMSVEWFSALQQTFEHSRRAYETVLTEHHAAIPEAAQLLGVVRREVARNALRMATNRYCRGAYEADAVSWLEWHAREVYPTSARLPEWWALQACKRIGPRTAKHVGPVADVVRLRSVSVRGRGCRSRSSCETYGAASR
jgi:hypothetical protein